MFAQVYVIARLPRGLSFFDYAIPNGLQVQVGDLVSLPFKGQEVRGLVRELSTESSVKTARPISAVLTKDFFTKNDFVRFERIAVRLEQSPSSLLFAAFGRAPKPGELPGIKASEKPSVGRELVADVRRYLLELNNKTELAVADNFEAGLVMAKALRAKTNKQMLVLVPQERSVDLVARYVNFPGSVATMHGKTPERVRGAIVEAWADGKLRTLIATRQAALLPAKELGVAVVLQSGNEEHLSARRNPRFDAREALRLLAADHQASIVWLDDLPRLEEARQGLVLPERRIAEVQIVNMAAKEEKNAHPHLSESLLEQIKKALQSQKKVLLCFNRKGVAKRLQCSDCGHLPLCGNCGHPPVLRQSDLVCPACGTEMWYPKQCPACGGKKLKLKGLGKANIALGLRKLFPGIALGEIEKGKPKDTQARIIVATDYFFTSVLQPFAAKEFALVADLAADLSLFADDYRSQEKAARKFLRLRNFGAAQGAVTMVQTWLPEVFGPMNHPTNFIQTELATRQRYGLPPFASRLETTARQQVIYDGPYGKNKNHDSAKES